MFPKYKVIKVSQSKEMTKIGDYCFRQVHLIYALVTSNS